MGSGEWRGKNGQRCNFGINSFRHDARTSTFPSSAYGIMFRSVIPFFIGPTVTLLLPHMLRFCYLLLLLLLISHCVSCVCVVLPVLFVTFDVCFVILCYLTHFPLSLSPHVPSLPFSVAFHPDISFLFLPSCLLLPPQLSIPIIPIITFHISLFYHVTLYLSLPGRLLLLPARPFPIFCYLPHFLSLIPVVTFHTGLPCYLLLPSPLSFLVIFHCLQHVPSLSSPVTCHTSIS